MSTARMLLRRWTSSRICSVHGSAPKMPISSEVDFGSIALRLHLVEDPEEVGRRDHDDPRPEVLDQLDLPLGHPPLTGTTVQPSRSAP